MPPAAALGASGTGADRTVRAAGHISPCTRRRRQAAQRLVICNNCVPAGSSATHRARLGAHRAWSSCYHAAAGFSSSACISAMPASSAHLMRLRIVAHASQADHLPERASSASDRTGEHAAKAHCTAARESSSWSRTASLISRAGRCTDRAQPWPLQADVADAALRHVKRHLHRRRRRTGCAARAVRSLGQRCRKCRGASVIHHHVLVQVGSSTGATSGSSPAASQAWATPSIRRSTRRACCRAHEAGAWSDPQPRCSSSGCCRVQPVRAAMRVERACADVVRMRTSATTGTMAVALLCSDSTFTPAGQASPRRRAARSAAPVRADAVRARPDRETRRGG